MRPYIEAQANEILKLTVLQVLVELIAPTRIYGV